MVVAGLIMVIGATIGTGLFKGEFHYCVTGSGGTPTSFAKIITKNVNHLILWKNFNPHHFRIALQQEEYG